MMEKYIVDQLNDDLNEAEKQISELQEEVKHERRVNMQLSQVVEDTQHTYDEACDNLHDINVNNDELKELLKTIKEKHEKDVTRIGSLVAENTAIREEYNADLETGKDALIAANTRILKLESELTSLNNMLVARNKRISELTKRLDEITTALEGIIA